MPLAADGTQSVPATFPVAPYQPSTGGVTVIKTADDDAVIGFIAGRKADTMTIETEKSGKKFELHADPKQASSRGGKGHQLMKRVTFKVLEKPVTIQPLANAECSPGVN